MKGTRFAIILTLLIGLMLVGCSSNEDSTASQQELYLSVAGSLKDAIEEIEIAYVAENPNVNIVINLGPSGQLQQQIEQGAPSDIFISAAQRQMNALEDKGLIDNNSRFDAIKNVLVLVTHKDNSTVNSIEDLTNSGVRNIGLGSPDSVPAGEYAKQTLEYVGIWEDVESKMVYGQNVRQVLTYVETQNAEAGFVFQSDTVVSDQVRIVAEAPAGAHEEILYPVAIVQDSKNKEVAADFMEFLKSDTVTEILNTNGFQRP
ncbi:molybdate ABC transporter substrate-binding protein [Desulfuribacillus alkaliarsenatis]|uniref:Molybdate ABC transporter substrate-binding protein n=1 Tax=Desulfuribacillus alkaliarsenatis TaxID=766136 RepID=A0A1E5G094_9FIRM|nr:molybdate ABC transporter substrate-binding protein [Desulfuribacillus alkaliarsenatis]OEF95897.1 molybdate ABC transporter substrate-binding protein [Desulfuribacillus alkaliarsenatis]